MARSALDQAFQKITIELNWMRNDINDYGFASHKGWQKPSKLYYQLKLWWMTHIRNNMILNCGYHSNGREDDEWWFILARVDCWLCIMMGKWWWVMMITSSNLARVDHGSWIGIQTGRWWTMIYSCASGSHGIFLIIFWWYLWWGMMINLLEWIAWHFSALQWIPAAHQGCTLLDYIPIKILQFNPFYYMGLFWMTLHL